MRTKSPAAAPPRPASRRPAARVAAAARVPTPAARAAAIVDALRGVAAGEVVGYGELARRAGLPGRARLAARVLREAGDAGLPWHRVVRSDGRIAFPEDSDAHAEQVARLRAEGVRVEGGRVRGQRAAPSLDALIWG